MTPEADGPFNLVQFEIQTPLDRDTIEAQIALSEARGLPEFVEPREVVVVASGPSARDEALWKRLERSPCVTVALNGALNLFVERGHVPTYWAVCDPQECVADFVPEIPPARTKYLLASKVHPKVHERLEGRDVRAWRIDDHRVPPDKLAAPTAVSITLTAMSAFALAGFNTFDVWGWDGCYLDGKHHCDDQSAPKTDGDVIVDIDGKRFNTNHVWAAESSDAVKQLQVMRWSGLRFAVNGPGMIAEMLRFQKVL